MDLPGNSQPRPRAGHSPPEPPRMVGKVLTGNGITRYERGTDDLVGGEDLSDAEREELLQLCRQRLYAFRMQRGEEVGCLLTQKPAASGTGAATAPRSAAR